MQSAGDVVSSDSNRLNSLRVASGHRALPEPPVHVSMEAAYRAALRCALLAAAPSPVSVNGRQCLTEPVQSKLSLRNISKRLGLAINSEVRPSAPSSKPLVTLPFTSLRNTLAPRSALSKEKRKSYDGERISPALPLSTSSTPDTATSGGDEQSTSSQRMDIPGGDLSKPLTKAFLRRFRARMVKIADGKAAPLDTSEPMIVEQLSKFVVDVMKQRTFKDRMQQCSTVAFLGTEFLIFCGQPAIEHPYQFIRVLSNEAVDCLRHQCVSSTEILASIDQFNAYADYVRETAEKTAQKPLGMRRKPSRIVRPYSEAFGKFDILPPSPYGDHQMTLYDVDGLVGWTHKVFKVDPLENDLSIRELQLTCTPKSGVEDYQRCLAALSFNVHPIVKQCDFSDTEAYMLWRQGEEQQLNQLVAYALTANPKLLSETNNHNESGNQVRCQYGVISYGKDEDPRHPRYVAIPEHPLECFRVVLKACLDHEIHQYIRLNENNSLLAPMSLKLLREIAIRWRINTLTRDITLLDCLCDYIPERSVALSHIRRTLDVIDKGFTATMAGGPLLSDKRYSYKVRVRLNRLLHQLLEDRLHDMISHNDEEQELVSLLEYIHADESFRNEHLRIIPLLKSTADVRWNRITHSHLYVTSNKIDVEQLMNLITAIQQDWLDLQIRFPKPLFNVDAVATILTVYLLHLKLKLNEWLEEVVADPNYTLDSVYPLYFSLKALKDIVLQKHLGVVDFDPSRWFSRIVERWLDDLSKSMIDTVTKLINKDPFLPISTDVKHSSSAIEMMNTLKNAAKFLLSLQWPVEEELAIYATRMSKIFSIAIQTYCSALEGYITSQGADIAISASAMKQGWFGSSNHQNSHLPTSNPIDVAIESCMCLNNLEVIRQQLDDLYYDLDVDEMSCILERKLPRSRSLSTNSLDRNSDVIYNVKVVLGEDLAGGDLAMQQGIYVILQSGTVQMARTRSIFHTLDPSWDASFTFSLSVAVEVSAIIMHRSKICGEAVFRLHPSLFQDYFAHDIWLNLKPQGRLLIRVSMEGEKDDIRFHFGKTFRTLKRTQADMVRVVVDEMSGYIRHCLSRKEFFRALHGSGTFRQMTSIFKNGASNRRNSASVLVNDENDVQSSLIEYLDKNLRAFSEHLRPEVSSLVFTRIWKEMLQNLENLMVPPLSEKPTKMKPLNTDELGRVFACLEQFKTYFDGNNNNQHGISLPRWESPKYQLLLLIRDLYKLPTDALIARYQQIEEAQANAHDSNNRRNKSILGRRNLGTIKQLAKKKSENSTDQLDCILRILRLRIAADKEARNFLTTIMDKRATTLESTQESNQTVVASTSSFSSSSGTTTTIAA